MNFSLDKRHDMIYCNFKCLVSIMLSCKIFKKERLLFNFGWSGAHSSLSTNA